MTRPTGQKPDEIWQGREGGLRDNDRFATTDELLEDFEAAESDSLNEGEGDDNDHES